MHDSAHDSLFRQLCFLAVIWLAVSGCGTSNAPAAETGTLDLTDWSFYHNGSIPLDGQWEFYPGQLYTPADFSTDAVHREPVFAEIPGPLVRHQNENSLFARAGFGTYRLRIHIAKTPALALGMKDVWSAYRLWINGNLLLESGRVGTDIHHEQLQYSRQVSAKIPDAVSLEIVVQISSFHASSGGMLQSPVLGPRKQQIRSHYFEWVWRNFVLGALAIMGLYHFLVYLFRRKERSNLLLSIYSWLWALNFAVTTTSVWMPATLFPDIPISFLRRIDHFTFYMSMPVNLYFIRSLFAGVISRRVVKAAFAVFSIVSLISCMLPLQLSEPMVVYMLVFVAPALLIAFAAICRAMVKGRPGARLAFAGYVVLTAMSINDMLLIGRVLNTVELVFIGIFLFMLLQSMALSKRFSTAFSAVEQLSVQQKKHLCIAAELEQRRLSEAEAKWNARFQQQEKLRFQFAPHFLFNTLNSIRASIIDDPTTAREMLTTLAELNRITIANRTRTAVTVAEELQMVRLYLTLEQARYGDYLTSTFHVSPETENLSIPCFLLQPLVENAIKHGKQTCPDELQVAITICLEDRDLILCVSNSGKWISPEIPSPGPSTGFGLNHLRERLKFWDGAVTQYEKNGWNYVEIRIAVQPACGD
ncbi:MAG: histidine kinase [Deltaproteobacteria bacterium]|nr:histidine kinase [Deltaproteobacteria bacterium]